MAFLPYYAAFTDYTPTVPKFYWDVYSQEERIKKICEEIDKLSAYGDNMADKVNKAVKEIEQVVESVDEAVNAVESMKADIVVNTSSINKLNKTVYTPVSEEVQ